MFGHPFIHIFVCSSGSLIFHFCILSHCMNIQNLIIHYSVDARFINLKFLAVKLCLVLTYFVPFSGPYLHIFL